MPHRKSSKGQKGLKLAPAPPNREPSPSQVSKTAATAQAASHEEKETSERSDNSLSRAELPTDPDIFNRSDEEAEDIPAESSLYSSHFQPLLTFVKAAPGASYRKLLESFTTIYYPFVLFDDLSNSEFLAQEAIGLSVVSANSSMSSELHFSATQEERISSHERILLVPPGIFQGMPAGLSTSNFTPAHMEFLSTTFNKFILDSTKAQPVYNFAALIKFSPEATGRGPAGYVPMFDSTNIYEQNPFEGTRFLQHPSLNIPTIPQPGPWFRSVATSYSHALWDKMFAFHTGQFGSSTRLFSRETLHNMRIFSELQRILYLFMLSFATHIRDSTPGILWGPALVEKLRTLERDQTRHPPDYGILPTPVYLHMINEQMFPNLGALALFAFIGVFPTTLTRTNHTSIGAVYNFRALPHVPLADNLASYIKLTEAATSQCFAPDNPHGPHSSLSDINLVATFLGSIDAMPEEVDQSNALVTYYRDFQLQARSLSTMDSLRALVARLSGHQGLLGPLAVARKPPVSTAAAAREYPP